MKSKVLLSLAAGLSTLLLAACGEPATRDETQATVPDAKPGIEVTNARFVLPAVSGNPGVLYFDIVNNASAATDLQAVHVAGAGKALMHNSAETDGVATMSDMPTVNLPTGQAVSFAPGGMHVMAMDVDPSLAAGGKTEVTFTFAGGDKLSLDVPVEAPGTAN